ncbi:MAG: aldo/keto reductase [Halobacteriaceae archaeon]
MEYRTLGRTGMAVSPLCLGTSRLVVEAGVDGLEARSAEEGRALLSAAWDRGLNFIDTANIYGRPRGESEMVIGDWLAGIDREQAVIASKVRGDRYEGPNGGGLSRKHIVRALKDSLDRLGTDYLDLYYLHWWDEDVPLATTFAALDDLVARGKVHHVGVSNFSPWQLVETLRVCEEQGFITPDVVQPEYSAVERPDALLEVCRREGIAVCGYRPLAGGFLTGKYDRGAAPPADSRGGRSEDFEGFDDEEWHVLEAVEDVATSLDATPAQVALAWVRETPGVTSIPIVGARSVDQLEENVGSASVALSERDRRQITDALGD